MKTYEKPAFTVVSLSANTAICACMVDVVGPNAGIDIPGGFGSGESGCSIEVDGYCKFSSAGGEFIYNS